MTRRARRSALAAVCALSVVAGLLVPAVLEPVPAAAVSEAPEVPEATITEGGDRAEDEGADPSPQPEAPVMEEPVDDSPDVEEPPADTPSAPDTPALDSPKFEPGAPKLVDEAEQALPRRQSLVGPMAVGDTTTPHAYFSLRQRGTPGGTGDGRGTFSAIIDKYTVNPIGPALRPQSGSHPTLSVSVPLEGDRPDDTIITSGFFGSTQTETQYRANQTGLNTNSLGVSANGEAYFTVQFNLETRTRSRTWAIVWPNWPAFGAWTEQNTRYLSIWRVNLETGSATQVVTRSTDPTLTANTLTGGSVNSAGVYHFSYLQAANNNAVNYRIYRLDGSTPQLAVNATTANNTSNGSFSGDIAFDGYDNLHLLVGGTGGSSLMTMLRSDQVPTSGNNTVTSMNVTTVTHASPGAGNQPAGIAFPFGRYTVWQGGVSHSLRNMGLLNTVASAQSYSTFSDQRDLASIVKRPTFQLRLVLNAGRQSATDQFQLSASPAPSAQTRTTTGAEGEGAPTDLAPAALNVTRPLNGSPLPATTTNPTATVPFSVTAAGTTDLANYNQSYSCVDATTGATIAAGSGSEHTAAISVFGNANVLCTITLTLVAPDLQVTKQAYRGAAELTHDALVNEGDVVEYRLRFDNRTGTAPVTDIDYIDHLADVLDDADFVSGSVEVAPVGGLVVGGVNGAGALIGDTLAISGAVPAGQQRVVTFRVKVKSNSESVASRNPRPVLPPSMPASHGGYRLVNYLVERDGSVPTTCDADNNTCTSNPVRAWSVTKLSQPASGAFMNAGGTPNYTIVVEKSDVSLPLEDVVVVDDLTDVLKVSRWDPTVTPPAPALAMGIYFYNENNELVSEISAANGDNVSDWIPAPVYNDVAPQGTWTLTTAAFDLPSNAKYAHVRFSTRLGQPEPAPNGSQHWAPAPISGDGTQFRNFASAESASLQPSRCKAGTVNSSLPPECQTEHTVVDGVVAFRKDGVGANEHGVPAYFEDLVGHELRIYQANSSGQIDYGVDREILNPIPANACVNTYSAVVDASDPPNCWRFYPIESGDQAGRWRSHNLAAGDYFLVETKAATHRNVNGTLLPIKGVQLLAQPVPFRVASTSDAGTPPGSVPIVNGQPAFLRPGQLDVYSSGDTTRGTVDPRCDPTERPVACVNPTGFLMIVSDAKMAALPLTGGVGLGLVMTGGAVALLMAVAGGLWWRRRQRPSIDSRDV